MSSETTFKRHIAAALKRRRLSLGWSQREAGNEMGVMPAELSRWENGYWTPQLKALWRLCAAYGLTPAELLREDEPLLPPDWPPEALDTLRESSELREAVAAILKGDGEGGEP
jgi:transcriptional regulator with XRE-family HTH domain